jgi:AcrR family transcriptional regulator
MKKKSKNASTRKLLARIPRTPTFDLSHESASRRAEILGVARKLFAEKGFQATTIREIANAAGILSGSLYHHFDTKEDMLHEITKDYAHHLREEYEKCASTAPNPREALRRMFHFGVVESIHHREIFAIIVIERSFVARLPRFRYLEETWQEIYRIWFGVLHEGVRAGLFRSNINLHLALRIIMDTVNMTVRWYRPGGRYTIEEVIETQADLLLNGLNMLDSKSGSGSAD